MIHEILSSILRISYSDVISCLGINLLLFLTLAFVFIHFHFVESYAVQKVQKVQKFFLKSRSILRFFIHFFGPFNIKISKMLIHGLISHPHI